MIFTAASLFLAALWLFWLAQRTRKASGLPGGRIIYTDTNQWGAVEEPLYDASLGLTGKPDYLVEKSGKIIPVEVKSSRVPAGPYDSHIYQLAAYCLLVTKVYGVRPPYGILHYTGAGGSGRSFAVNFTPALEAATLTLLDEIRGQERRREVHRSHEEPARCRGCGFHSICDQRLS